MAQLIPFAAFNLQPPPPSVPKKAKRRRKPPVSLNDAQLLSLLGRARETCLRDWVMMLVTYWHGLRADEACSLRVQDFDLAADPPAVMVRRGKGSEGGWQALQGHENPLLNEAAAVELWLLEGASRGKKGGLRERGNGKRRVQKRQQSAEIVAFSALPPQTASGGSITAPPVLQIRLEPLRPFNLRPEPQPKPDNRVFPIHRCHFWKLVHGYALAVGIPKRKCKTHMLKHTIAKHLIRCGLPVNEVQAWMGWTSLETANWYLMADEEELADRVGRAIRGKEGLRALQQGSLFS